MKRTLRTIAVLVLILTAAGAYYAFKVKGGSLTSVAAVAAFALLMIPYFALGFDGVVDRLRDLGRQSRSRLALMGLLLMVPGIFILITEGGDLSQKSLAHMTILALYVTVPIMLLAGWGAAGSTPTIIDAAAVLLLWLPVEMQYFEKFWLVPAGNPSYVLAKTLGMELGLFCFVVVRRLDGVGYRFRLTGEDFTIGAIALAVFLVVGVPLALGTGFVQFEPHWLGPGKWALLSLGIFFFIALPEEVLFRGLIFNMLQRTIKWGGPYPALAISSVIFGLAHLNNPPGDWRYALLATCAGLCYGWAYLRTGSLLASSYCHAMVDIIGRSFFPHGHG
ncbi:MAG TPA: type II CAAX endopeptidase family protein [Candidatus Polarisedimenticolia bacterium]|nr:type II CAAX endopeptidase family protein [Candidatus Polarisedimenticolia bacterium]